jgi:hypothetical protein
MRPFSETELSAHTAAARRAPVHKLLADGGMAMNPNLTSAVSEFTKKSEFSKSGLAADSSERAASSPKRTELDHQSAAAARQARRSGLRL